MAEKWDAAGMYDRLKLEAIADFKQILMANKEAIRVDEAGEVKIIRSDELEMGMSLPAKDGGLQQIKQTNQIEIDE